MEAPTVEVLQLLVMVFVLLSSLSIHEAAHAWSADRFGDPTARILGRVTLNPIPHIDPVGTILFPILGYFTGFIFGWAKPVPVVPQNLKNPRRDHAIIAAAGPASNFVLAILAFLGLKLLQVFYPSAAISSSGFLSMVHMACSLGLLLNVTLGVFNLLPIPPLDGGWILSGILPGPMARWIQAIQPYGFLILILLLYTGALYRILGPILEFVRRLAL